MAVPPDGRRRSHHSSGMRAVPRGRSSPRSPSTRSASSGCLCGTRANLPNPPGGDIGPFVGFLPGIVVQSNDFMFFHTSGDSPDTISPPGLANATRSYARIIDEVNKLPLSDLQRPPVVTPKPRIDFANCPAWVLDSSAACTENSERACAVTGPGCNP